MANEPLGGCPSRDHALNANGRALSDPAAPLRQTPPAEQVSPVVQYCPSSQDAPVFAVQALVELAVSQRSQGLAGLPVDQPVGVDRLPPDNR